MIGNYDDYFNSEIVFVLEIDFDDVKYFFSTKPIFVENDDDLIQYVGTMSEPNITEQTEIMGFNIESDSVSLELNFQGINLIEMFLTGRFLDGSHAEIAYYTIRDGVPLQTYDQRIKMFRGRIIDPIIGDPLRDVDYVAFSIENNLNGVNTKILDPQFFEMTTQNFPFIFDNAVGKILPLVFGAVHNYPVIDSSGRVYFQSGLDVPAYLIQKQNPTGQAIIGIANHEVTAGRITLVEGRGYEDTFNIGHIVRNDGLVIASCDITGSGSSTGGVASDATVGKTFDDLKYYGKILDGGGMLNPYGEGFLEGGGDVCRFFLEKSKLEIDWDAWNGVASLLNRYKFSGYINDPDVNCLDWLKDNIIEFLPIEIVNGSNGIRPVVSLYHYTQNFDPLYHLTDSSDFQIVSPLNPISKPDKIVNDLTARFAWSGRFENFQTSIRISGESGSNGLHLDDPICRISSDRYGVKQETIEMYYVYDYITASKIIRDRVRIRAINPIGLEIEAVPVYGYLEIGDVVTLTSDRLVLVDAICQIVAKQWNGGNWKFIVNIEINKYINRG
jgi:hypothetical protein